MKRLALIAVLGSLAVAAPASAQKAHISVAKARGEIMRYFGPGTIVTKCQQFSPRLIGCDYETPLENIGIEGRGEGGPWSPWQGFATVDRYGVHANGIE